MTTASGDYAASTVAPEVCPIGSIIAFAGPLQRLPTNWLLCDGRALDKTVFSVLFDRIGTTWGGDGAPKFNLPDLRGMFLRGVDRNAGGIPTDPARDPDRDSRVPPQSGPNAGNGGNNVGSLQEDEFGQHSHHYEFAGNSHPDGPPKIQSGGPNYPKGNWESSQSGGHETRPKNAYVFWVIRAS